MKKVVSILIVSIFSILLVSCAFNGSFQFEEHYVSMDENIVDEHVRYEEGSLYIDGDEIELPEGDKLRISYRNVDGVATYTVKVDGKLIKTVEPLVES